ncbi:hypothetical protein JKP88DRAFT_255695 [Tribonema minus]|uniref:Uncharacterized protein n=1 Tax=Tribonema minus TaxID=303371 RepID=A0A836CFE1_9STRA|nr:hypothetical protein JKP88DRAFT_255695 [Tribonema minus]
MWLLAHGARFPTCCWLAPHVAALFCKCSCMCAVLRRVIKVLRKPELALVVALAVPQLQVVDREGQSVRIVIDSNNVRFGVLGDQRQRRLSFSAPYLRHTLNDTILVHFAPVYIKRRVVNVSRLKFVVIWIHDLSDNHYENVNKYEDMCHIGPQLELEVLVNGSQRMNKQT